MHEWEADHANRAGAALLFWCWYLPHDCVRWRNVGRALVRAAARGRVLLRYPVIPAPAPRAAAKVPLRSR